MSVDLSELLALPREERLKLAEALFESTAPADIGRLLREFVTRMARTNQALNDLHERFSRLDETLERNRAEVRDAALRSRTVWASLLTV